MKMSVMEFDCIVDNGLIVLIAQLICLIGCMHLFKQALFHLSHSDFHTVQGEDGLIDQILLLRIEYLNKGVSLTISLVRIMQSKSCRYGDERTLIVRSHMSERTVYYIGARTSRARPNQALACATE